MSFFAIVGRFISEFARFILFFASIIFLIASSSLLLVSSHGRADLAFIEVGGIHTVLSITVGFSVYLIILSAIGIFASFFSNTNTIKLLAIMTALNVGLGLIVVFTSSPKVELVHQELLDKLKELQGKYDWDHKESSKYDVKKATKAWDSIQLDLNCCGIDSPKEWANFRPKAHENENVLPMSCCQSLKDTNNTSGYCYADKFQTWDQGCSSVLEWAFPIIMYLITFVVCFNAVIGILATVVLCCNPYSRNGYDGRY